MKGTPSNKGLHQTGRGGVAFASRRRPVVEARPAGEAQCYAGYWRSLGGCPRPAGEEWVRKRLRKKLRLREFVQLAFTARYQVKAGLLPAALDSLLDRFILEAIEANGLHCGGGGGPAAWDFMVCANGRRSSSEADCQQVRTWLEAQEEVSSGFVGNLQDAWRDEPGDGSAIDNVDTSS